MSERHKVTMRPGDTLVVHVDGGGEPLRERSPEQQQQHHRPRPHRLIETKPFFLTSEFVLALAAWVALMLTTLATDSLDAELFLLLSIAIAAGYMLSRGFAKANAASSAWDPRER